jgi:hypothetical protein
MFRELGFAWYCRNTAGLRWLGLILDARVGARYHKGTDFTLWWYLRSNFYHRHPWFYKTRQWFRIPSPTPQTEPRSEG